MSCRYCRIAIIGGGNAERVFKRARATGIPASDIDGLEFSFAAGSMFWFRPQALSRLCDLALDADDFEAEDCQVDGTLAHAVERLFGLVAVHAGFKIAEIDSREARLSDVPFQLRLLMRQTHELATQVKTLTGQIAEKDERLHGLAAQIGDLMAELAATRHRVEALLSSASWRWTAPLRATWQILGGDKR
jgi:lipopolysaccharide biosynthesis protein